MEHGDDPGLPGWKVGSERIGDGFKGHAVERLPLLELKDETVGWAWRVARPPDVVLQRGVEPKFLEELLDGLPVEPPPAERTLLEVRGLKRSRKAKLGSRGNLAAP